MAQRPREPMTCMRGRDSAGSASSATENTGSCTERQDQVTEQQPGKSGNNGFLLATGLGAREGVVEGAQCNFTWTVRPAACERPMTSFLGPPHHLQGVESRGVMRPPPSFPSSAREASQHEYAAFSGPLWQAERCKPPMPAVASSPFLVPWGCRLLVLAALSRTHFRHTVIPWPHTPPWVTCCLYSKPSSPTGFSKDTLHIGTSISRFFLFLYLPRSGSGVALLRRRDCCEDRRQLPLSYTQQYNTSSRISSPL
jgi:hypothetical protein